MVAVIRKEVIGCAAIELLGTQALLRSVAVDRPWRRRGIGRALVVACLDFAQRRGATAVALVTMFWNTNFFRGVGFATVSRRQLPAGIRLNPMFTAEKYRYTTPMILQRTPASRKGRHHPFSEAGDALFQR